MVGRHSIFFAAGTVALASSLASPANAQDRPDSAAKTVTIISSFASGGGYDLYARLYAGHVGRHLPGAPAVLVQNMPGAGGLVGTNYIYNVAPKDGATMGVVPQTVAITQVLGAQGVKYDVAKFNWVGRITSNTEVQQTWHTSKVKTIADAKTYPAILAGTGPGSSSVVFPMILTELFGMKFKVTSGYEGANMASLAMERGEVEGIVRPWSVIKTVNPEWLSEKKINLIVQYAVRRNPELKEVPAVVELAQNDVQRQILTLYASGSDIGRAIVAPPGLSPGAVATLREAFDATMKDPQFLAEIRKSKLDFDPLPGAELQQIVSGMGTVPADVIETARKFSAAQK
jgi:tripartite-type tricarboxylate transporter receptor subunit TctC